MKTIQIVLDPKSLLIALISIALYKSVDTEMGKAISFALAFLFSLDFIFHFLKGLLFPKPDFKIIDSQMADLPEDIREDMKKVEDRIREHLRTKKCSDPHCDNCHPELNE